jgi:hypothetical protein
MRTGSVQNIWEGRLQRKQLVESLWSAGVRTCECMAWALLWDHSMSCTRYESYLIGGGRGEQRGGGQ